MGSVGCSELGDERLDTLLDGVLGEHHRPRDLLIGVPLRQVTKELELPWRERLAYRDRSAGLRLVDLHVTRVLGALGYWDRLGRSAERPSLGGAEGGESLDRGLKRRDHLARRRVLRHIPIRPGA